MDHKKIFLAGILVVGIAGTAGCGILNKTSSPIDQPPPGANQPVDKNMETVSKNLYFVDENGFVAPLKVDIPKVEGIATEALSYLTPDKSKDFIKDTGLRAIIPDGTKISVDIKENLATVDFGKEVLGLKTAKEEQQFVDAVVWTLTEFPSVKQVQIKVNGNIIPFLPISHTPIGQPLTRENGINLEIAPNINPTETTKVTLYFQGHNKAGNLSYLVPITRMIGKNNENILDTTIAQLVAGPTTSGLSSTLSDPVKLISGTVEGDTATLDFESLFTDGADKEQRKVLDSIVLSVLENTPAQKVKVTVKGQPLSAIPGIAPGLDLGKPMLRPAVINEKSL